MTKMKIKNIAIGYLKKEKKQTVIICFFLTFMVAFLIIGNQLFYNMRKADIINAEALAGKQHVSYNYVSKKNYQAIKNKLFVKKVGMCFSLGQTKDGTSFAYIDATNRYLSATVAKRNIKEIKTGRWAKEKNEVVFTENYLKKYGLKIGDSVHVSLTENDANTGEELFHIDNLNLKIVGVIEDLVGFSDRKAGYVSKKLADDYIKKYDGKLEIDVQLRDTEHFNKKINNMNKLLGYESDDVNVRLNNTLRECNQNEGKLQRQNNAMNLIVWIICVMVIYNIFYNRLFNRKREFGILRKIGFQISDLFQIVAMEFGIIVGIGIISGVIIGSIGNVLIYHKVIEPVISNLGATQLLSSNLSARSIGMTIGVLILVIIPSVFQMIYQLRKVSPANIVKCNRMNKRKTVMAIMILALSAILISEISFEDNKSDSGIKYVKTYVPGEMQVTAGSITEGIQLEQISSISKSMIDKMKHMSTIKETQIYKVNYESSGYICPEKSTLNKEATGYYEMLEESEQIVDGKKQCPYNMVLAETDNLKKLVPSYKRKKGEHVIIMEKGLAEAMNLSIGDNLTLYDEELMATGSKKGVKSVSVRLIGIKKDMVLSESHVGPNIVIIDEDTAKLFKGRFVCQVVNLWIDEGTEGIAMKELNGIEGIEHCSIHNANQQMKEFIDSHRNQKFLHCFFVILFAVIGLATYFNAVFVNLLSRKHDFSIMYKLGIQRVEIYQMVVKEGMYHGIIVMTIVLLAKGIFYFTGKAESFDGFIYLEGILFVICFLFPIIVISYIFQSRMINLEEKASNMG